MSEPDDFRAEDYRFTADLLLLYTATKLPDLFRAVCSNNLNIILAALDLAEKHAAKLEEETP
jgi:hypothetical protein